MTYLIITFFSAFLLFQVQPLIAKLILPQFGGGAAVWTACLLFFQTFLLLGYFYVHLLCQLKSLKHQVSIHAAVLVLSWFFLPIGIAEIAQLTELQTQQPLAAILMLLTASIGVPYFLVSTTAPLLQRWMSIIQVGKLPYRLYAWSNAGSLLALLSFPFVIEPWLSSSQQVNAWSLGFVLLTALLIYLMQRLFVEPVSDNAPLASEQNPVSSAEVSFRGDGLLWVLLSGVGVVILVSTTNAMTQNIPPIPFLWIMPLALYLLSFIISFHSGHWYVRWYWFCFFAVAAFAGLLMHFIGSQFDIISQVLIYAAILFSACMICHGELAKLKPDVARLTWFYLLISFGGFLGSATVVFVAQNFFQQFSEYPLAIIAVFLLMGSAIALSTRKLSALVLGNFVMVILLSIIFWQLNQRYVENNVYSARNFYGILSVKDLNINGQIERRLIDGTTSHGSQILANKQRNIPLSYYRKNTGVSLALAQLHLNAEKENSALNAGFIGLGAGTLAAYGQANDSFTFYELNPAVIYAAQHYFSYLSDSAAQIAIKQGDARVSLTEQLQQQGKENFDLLVVDAFAGDAIPQHLLTLEAFELYFQHLSADGVLALHVSNSHLDLTTLVKATAQVIGKSALYFNTHSTTVTEHDAQWVLVANNPQTLEHVIYQAYSSVWPKAALASKALVWRDDHSNLLSLLK